MLGGQKDKNLLTEKKEIKLQMKSDTFNTYSRYVYRVMLFAISNIFKNRVLLIQSETRFVLL